MMYDIDVLGLSVTQVFCDHRQMPVITLLMQDSFMTLRKENTFKNKCNNGLNTKQI